MTFEKRIPLPLLFIDFQFFFKVKTIALGKLSTSVGAHLSVHICSKYDSGVPLDQMCYQMLETVQMFLRDVCAEGGANTSCSCVNMLLFSFTLGRLSQREGCERGEPAELAPDDRAQKSNARSHRGHMWKNSPHMCMFVYTWNQQLSLFPFHASVAACFVEEMGLTHLGHT